jgi:type IV pilus assembly protein PilY1
MRRHRSEIFRVGVVGGAALAALAAPCTAWAQADTEPPLPNVMLLIDTSGSMEYMAEPDPVTKKPRLPNCELPSPANSQTYSIQTNKAYEQNRWTNLVTVLTGEFPRYACVAESRSTPLFVGEYAISGQQPYDRDYYLPFNRIVATNTANNEACVVGPNATTWPGSNLFAYPNNAIKTHRVGQAGTNCALIGGEFRLDQSADGLLDVFREKARFGLMTFDSLPDRRTGYASNNLDAAGGLQGHWSYYNGWDQNNANYAKGKPELCATAQDIEVGARNAAAPPWEGRMIAFGDPAADTSTVANRNEQIQQTIMAVRPFGATPLAGMLSDAENFFFYDTTPDKASAANKAFGPHNDPYVLGGCRQQFTILLTDGVPNLDLRPGCKNNPPGGPDGTCPFSEPSAIAKRMATPGNPNKKVRTFVVGFALSSADTGGPINLDCKTLTGQNDAACINPTTDGVRACCEMAKIAYEGGTGAPRFADNKQELRKALNDILSEVAQGTTSRTTPVFASAGSAGGGYSGGGGVAAFNILTSFKVSTGGLWQGVIERQRYTCDKNSGVYTVKPENIAEESGDRFSTNIASGQGPSRRFYTVVPTQSTNYGKSGGTLRNSGSITDGLGTLTSVQITDDIGSFFNNSISGTMGLAATGAPLSVCGTIKTPVSVDDCRRRILRWYTGLPMIDGSLFDRVGSPLGSVYHSTPVVVGPPSEFLRDESYSAFADKYKTRAPVVYTATTDGQLHAFKLGPAGPVDTVKVDNKNNNELWSFVPPAVLPDLKTIYPGIERRLLDTPLFSRDVVFERKRADALNASGSFNDWRSVVITGLGPSRGGYFALDVTQPEYKLPESAGPKWLWQITGDANGNPLFGASASPVITTLFLKTASMSEAREVAVAILPGGYSAAPVSSVGVARAQTGAQTLDSKWKFRPQVRSYNDSDPARSLTVVRLDTGEVIRRFHRCKAGNVAPLPYDSSLLSRSTCAPFDSPITSVPLPFPNGTGQSSTRVFVGDQDGALWRVDLSNPDPAQWKVDPFFDAYAPYTNNAFIGQPVLSQPVASLDPLGNLVVVFSTGDQDRFDGTVGMRNVIWSVREVPDLATGKVGSRANWHLGINTNESVQANPAGSADGNWLNGIRVAGPLSLFGGAVYFSTYRPPSPGVNACDPGSSVLWAVDYLNNSTGDTTGDAAPKAALDISGTLYHAREYANALIFGVGIQKLPACYDTSTVDDPYIGFGSGSTSVSDMSQPEYRLVVQTGAKGNNNAQAQTKFETMSLRPPPSGALISSWASVVELAG